MLAPNAAGGLLVADAHAGARAVLIRVRRRAATRQGQQADKQKNFCFHFIPSSHQLALAAGCDQCGSIAEVY